MATTQRLGTAALSNRLLGPHCDPLSWWSSGTAAWALSACSFVHVEVMLVGVSRGLSVLDVQVDRLCCHCKPGPKQPTSSLLLQVGNCCSLPCPHVDTESPITCHLALQAQTWDPLPHGMVQLPVNHTGVWIPRSFPGQQVGAERGRTRPL